jgi:hypothetical protein
MDTWHQHNITVFNVYCLYIVGNKLWQAIKFGKLAGFCKICKIYTVINLVALKKQLKF